LLTAEGCKQRRERLWQSLAEKPDVIVLADPVHLTYFANFYASPFVFKSQNARALLVLRADGASTLITDNVQASFAQQAHVDQAESAAWYDGVHSAGSRQQVVIDAAMRAVGRQPGTRIGVDLQVPSVLAELIRTDRPGIELLRVDETIRALRRSKDPDELAVLRRAVKAAEAGAEAALRDIKPGMTELQAYERIANAAMEAAGEQAVVYGDFVSGTRTEEGGGPPSQRVIEPNDLFILDFSVVMYGYRSDFANTFVVDGGTPSPRQKELADVCIRALYAAEGILKAGVPCREVDCTVREVYREGGLGDNKGHHTGHGLGLGHPDPPYLVPESSETLQAGDVITIEPGFVEKGTGGVRFERNYLITEEGYELLSNHRIGLTA
jgi:Xaa-Pro aminopeptidase